MAEGDSANEGVQRPTGLSDVQLLDLVQRQTLRYFWDFGHPVSGMARERSNYAFAYDPMVTVTTGGTGFGIMGMIAGAERGFLPRDEVRQRIHQICGFLSKAEKHHGVFPHFMNGETGAVIPFSPKDDGGDLVETSFLMAGLLTARQYFRGDDPGLAEKINMLWLAVEWSHHVRTEDTSLLWHSSPSHPGTEKSLRIRGWNECLISYVLAAASPTYPVARRVYDACWTGGSEFRNGGRYYGYDLPLGPELGGPLFFSHYSFLGLDPRGLHDQFANYWQQNRNHTLINRAYCVENPRDFEGYGTDSWGLTASDNHRGYAAHSPTEDWGVITPTAALSAFPYTPEESMAALRHFYDELGDRLWGPYGFRDAFNPTEDWVAESNLAIDQGPVIVMIENYRSALIWDLFMSCPEIAGALEELGFSRNLAVA